MIAKALLARFESRARDHEGVERLLASARAEVAKEPATAVWFALRFGRGDYGIFDAFADDAGRQAHLDGAVAAALMAERDALLDGPPKIQPVDVLAHKLTPGVADAAARGLVLTFKAKQGHESEVAGFLRNARGLVEQEPGTTAWFALQLDSEHFSIFDVFPDNGARFAHLTGHVPRELAKHSLSLLGGMPEMHLVDVLAVECKPALAG